MGWSRERGEEAVSRSGQSTVSGAGVRQRWPWARVGAHGRVQGVPVQSRRGEKVAAVSARYGVIRSAW